MSQKANSFLRAKNRNVFLNDRRLKRILFFIVFTLVIGLFLFSAEQILEAMVTGKMVSHWFIATFFVFLTLLGFLSLWFSQNPSDILGTSVQMSSVDMESPRRFLLTGYSPIKGLIDTALEFSKTENSLEYLAQDTETYRANENLPDIRSWQQNARAIFPHIETLEAIYILRPNEDDAEFDKFKTFLTNCLKSVGRDDVFITQVHQRKNTEKQFSIIGATNANTPPSYEDYSYVYEGFRSAIKIIEKHSQVKVKSEDMIIDITPGLKPFSIAAAALTLNENIKFSYVTQSGHVLFYNADIRIAGG